MSKTEFIIVTAIILFVAFSLGWFAHWLIHRFTKVSGSEMGELDRQAIIYLQQRESELSNQMHQTEAELNAAMDGLRDARQEAEELRAYIERLSPS